MEKNGTTASATAEEIDTMIAAGDTRTNWDCVRATGEEEIARQVAGDPDLAEPPGGWKDAIKGLPFPLAEGSKKQVTIRLDPQVVAHFKRSGRGWQSRINAVLRSYVESGR
jgi:uncharacterized protein (DUF4415 family)